MGWLSGWRKRVKITIDSGDITANLTWFPVLVYLSVTCGKGGAYDLTPVFDEVGANKLKIAVTKADGVTQLYVEVEKWDSVNEKAWLWVSRTGWVIDSGTDTDIYLYYDNSHANNVNWVGDPNSTPAENVWDANFKLVTHMRDDPDNTKIRDSTNNNNDGTKKGANEPQVVTTGQIDDAQNFVPTDDYIALPVGATVKGLTQVTLECWFKTDVLDGNAHCIYMESNSLVAGASRVLLQIDTDNKLQFGGRAPDTDGFTVWVDSTTVLAPNTWYYIVAVFDSVTDNHKIYINTASQTNNLAEPAFDNTNPIVQPRIGLLTTGLRPWDGIIDEFRITNTIRNDAWVKACYETQRDDLLDFGEEESFGVIWSHRSPIQSALRRRRRHWLRGRSGHR